MTRQRLFLALWPPAAVQETLAQHARGALQPPGRLLQPGNIHLTLCFLGALDAAQRARVEAAAGTIRGDAFVLKLDRFGHWPRPRVFWSAPAQTPEPLVQLVHALHAALRAEGISVDVRPFRAHVTLARKVSEYAGPVTHPTVVWPVRDFCLVESRTLPQGAQYHPLNHWPLTAVSDRERK